MANQVELPDDWLGDANPWEYPRSERTYLIRFGGRVEHHDTRAHWVDTENIKAVAFDRLVPGYDSRTVNTLRLWSPKAIGGIDLSAFNRGAFLEALAPACAHALWAACFTRTTARPRGAS